MALKVNDLRVNNWYKFIKTSDNSNELVYEQISNGCMIDVAVIIGEPIPLTPEIIDSIKPNLADYGYTHKWTVTGRLEIRLGYSYITTIEFLHEYQNIYFTLLKSELTYIP